MRTRLLLGGLAAALSLATVAPAHAAPRVTCAEGFEVVCTVLALTCAVPKSPDPCHP
jgi:hypothetical protein